MTILNGLPIISSFLYILVDVIHIDKCLMMHY